MQKDETQASTLLQKFLHTLNEKVVQHSGEIINKSYYLHQMQMLKPYRKKKNKPQ